MSNWTIAKKKKKMGKTQPQKQMHYYANAWHFVVNTVIHTAEKV